ncbi:N-acylethanolamine-hydrolyzing acid amidase-like [Leucoraja erinacea]|uniref:N-acylethanolamine-hydrolyzing acid amidase-like n=1 Tax=Leucoraja erinaceus TaxID=7782 RepID=UPI0024563FEF|nr:N-acylethanolamine-hydrolyzing acid amidase-like [Leucoraja erinacea]
MPAIRLLVLLGLLAAAAQGDWSPPLFNLSLDTPPSQRWEPLLNKYSPARLKHDMDQVVRTVAPMWAVTIINMLAPVLSYMLPQPYGEEIEGICKFLGVTLGEGLLINYAYEALGACTSIVVQDSRGMIIHSRNMDFPFTDILRNVTIDIQFVKNGQIVYKGTTFLGFVGLWTGQKANKFAITGNDRAQYHWWNIAIAVLLKHYPSPSWLIRDTLAQAADFQEALEMLAYTPITSNVYFILSGVKPDEGTIITRNIKGPANIWPLMSSKGEWYRVQTNYDHWKAPPPWDDRRTPTIHALENTTQKNISLDTMFKILSTRPMLNRITVYTTLMCAAEPYEYRTVIRSPLPMVEYIIGDLQEMIYKNATMT